MDELFEKYQVAKAKRVEAFGERLNAILAELGTRNLANIATSSLLTLALKYGEFMKDELEPLNLQGEDLPFDMSSISAVPDKWPV